MMIMLMLMMVMVTVVLDIGHDDDPRTDHEMVILFWVLQIFRGNENEFFGEFYGDGMLEVRVDESDDLIS